MLILHDILSSFFFPQKKCQTPKSESKKVTFGLNKNKTAGIRGQDSTLFGLYNYLIMTYISSVISDNLVSRSSFLCRSIVLMRLSYLFFFAHSWSPEFRKTDRSLLVSPEGSSRVPFDPQQKPLFGVLKSPEASLTKGTKTKSTLKTTPKRPTAADFF
jgi:hypothetical protein